MPVSVDEVISNEELQRRPARRPNRDGERRALELLVEELAGSPRRVLQTLSDVALELCQAHSSGISLVEQEGDRNIFRWHAVSGSLSPCLWNTLPREYSPCGTVLDRGAPQLMTLPERHFTPLQDLVPRVFEVLLIPFSVGSVIVGTVWIVAHDDTRRFDGEDRRVVSDLAKFAAVAYAGLSSLSTDDVVRFARLSKAGSVLNFRPPRSIQKRVLIIDAGGKPTGKLAAQLHDMGHQVHVANDVLVGLELSAKIRPNVVLLDMSIPYVTSLDLAAKIRQELEFQVRIVALTDFGNDEVRSQSFEAGFDQHFVKPLDPHFLKQLIG